MSEKQKVHNINYRLPTAAEIEAEHRKFVRGVARCYVAAIALFFAALAYFS